MSNSHALMGLRIPSPKLTQRSRLTGRGLRLGAVARGRTPAGLERPKLEATVVCEGGADAGEMDGRRWSKTSFHRWYHSSSKWELYHHGPPCLRLLLGSTEKRSVGDGSNRDERSRYNFNLEV